MIAIKDNTILVDALYYDQDLKKTVEAKFGLLFTDFKRYGEQGRYTEIAQFFKLINDGGLVLARHIFEGLARPLYCDGSRDGDKKILVYTRSPRKDYEWVGDGVNGGPVEREAPANHVFAVFASPNLRHVEQYPSVKCWINHWTWIAQDGGLAEAPIDWVDRFERKLWTREN